MIKDEPYIEQMIALAKKAMQNAYVPLSKFPVGACIKTLEGKLFFGCNWENSSTPLGECAEGAAISSMISNGYQKISAIVVIAEKVDTCPPCGACRQRLSEFSSDDGIKIYLCNFKEIITEVFTLKSILPNPFVLNLGLKI